MKLLKCIPPLALLISGMLLAPGVAGAVQSHGQGHHSTYVCNGGDIASGFYNSILVEGVCYAPSGNVDVRGNLTVAPGALFDAITEGDPTASPALPATVDISGNVFVGKGAALLFGCSPNITCTAPPAITYDTIGGSVYAYDALGVVIHSAAIGGSVSVLGGGGGAAADTCNAQTPGDPTVTNLEPWSEDAVLDYTPVYTDVEDTTIGGNLTIAGLDSCWLGALRNQISGSFRLLGNTMGDPDAMEVDNNLVLGNMPCFNNSPAVQFGDGGSAPNIVKGWGLGECGFNVTAMNPAPEAGLGTGVSEHVTVPMWRLGTYHGTYAATPEASLPAINTSAGDQINGDLFDFTLSGGGLNGTGTYDSTQQPGSTGAAILSTTYPDGWSKFTGYLNCTCSFDGQSGAITIRVYGTTSPSGFTFGTFFVTSGGASVTPGLQTLAGGGTFTSKGEPAGSLAVTEYLAIT